MNVSNTKYLTQKFLHGIAIISLIAFSIVSCEEDNNVNGINSDKAQLKVNLTDAPANYQQVNIDVQGMRIHYAPNEDSLEEQGKWIDLPVEPVKINLLELTNGVDTLLASAELEPGRYNELRLILGADNTVMVDSLTENLKVPSGQQSGYKIKFETDLEAGEELEVTVDFDAARSVHKAGNSGKYILRPVLKAFVESGDKVETGAIGGIVEPLDATPDIFAINEDDTVGSTHPDSTGNFLLKGLETGQYDVSFETTSDTFIDTTLSGVTVEKGQKTDVGTVNLTEQE
jgi:hypothetical protein